MKPEFDQIYESVPADPPRSRLEPYRSLILRWRRQGRTYERIRELLRERCKVSVALSTLYDFIHKRSKPRTDDLESPALTELGSEGLALGPITASEPPTFPRPPAAETTQNRPSLQSLRNKPALTPKPTVLEEFHYDEDKPLTIDRTIKE
jgi:hypothetical protein